ncbi:hydroxycinnamoyltransferase 2 isoform X1 [Selaginella moellendorffii]|uniref:hydroxycinnamoyltransferase 2 isoform X1 n=1 Tax=Selaginella moellendorffii TaxID=88036 RepID=UPI000D1C561C|nr:hydroxycinnamoyltransferase 2 isoform X1 [Selaginella moellendorffii]|eukprot:XP_024519280.1 hydroxycinnamoyltransferase 2 isoform X1 [Selaginella moellendorffii]
MKVEVEEICLVPPEINKPGKALLSPLAHFAWEVQYRTRFLFFERPSVKEGACFDALIVRLKAGLRKALGAFYLVGGRLVVREDDLMEVDCNGDGIMFIRASSDVGLGDLSYSDGDFQLPDEDLSSLAQTAGHVLNWPWPSDAPLLFIQATRFSCGGLCISIKFNHQVMDGTSAWHFWKSWAEVCRGQEISLLPVWSDQPIKVLPPRPTLDKLEIPHYLRRAPKQAVLSATLEDPTKYSNRCFVFKAEVLARLKEKDPGFTTFQLLTAHLWEKITVARQLHGSTAMFFAVNCRKRFRWLDPGYGGQGALIIGTTPLPASQVGRDGLALLRKTIQEFTEQQATRFCELVEMLASDEQHRIGLTLTKNDVIVGSSFYFPVYEDFGFGKPVGMAAVAVPNDGRMYYFPGRDEGSVAAYVSLRDDAMDRLLGDSTLMNP